MMRKRTLFQRRPRPFAQQTCLQTGPGGDVSAALASTSENSANVFTFGNQNVYSQTHARQHQRTHNTRSPSNHVQEIINDYFGRELDQGVNQLGEIQVEAEACDVEADAVKCRRHAKPGGRNLPQSVKSGLFNAHYLSSFLSASFNSDRNVSVNADHSKPVRAARLLMFGVLTRSR